MGMWRTRWIINGVAGAGPCYWTLYWDAGASTPQQAMDACSAYLAPVKTVCQGGISWQPNNSVEAIDETTGDLTAAVTTTSVQVLATGAGGQVPGQVQVLNQLRTGVYVAGRQLQGHFNLPGTLQSLQTAGGTFNGAAAVSTGLTALTTTGPAKLVVWSRPFAGAGTRPPRLGSFAHVNGFNVQGRYATLRSRNDL